MHTYLKMVDRTFVKITNKDIYKKLEDVEAHVMKTNGKVAINRWIAITALSMATGIAGMIIGGKIW